MALRSHMGLHLLLGGDGGMIGEGRGINNGVAEYGRAIHCGVTNYGLLQGVNLEDGDAGIK